MFGKMFLGLAAAVFAFASLTSAANAGTIQYSTSATLNGVAGTTGVTVAGSTITFQGTSHTETNPLDMFANLVFGTFNVTNPTGNINPALIEFVLTINQTFPDPDASGTIGTSGPPQEITGALVNDPDTGFFRLTFANPLLTLNGVLYTANNNFSFGLGSSVYNNNSAVSVSGDLPTLTPLPLAAWGGMALMGIIGAAKLRKGRQEAL